ncbi:MAG: hypothetical protein U5M23_11400 [Marinagarivorans sp.]|nr:hypothetical protein [Marinagarivorans sp.]
MGDSLTFAVALAFGTALTFSAAALATEANFAFDFALAMLSFLASLATRTFFHFLVNAAIALAKSASAAALNLAVNTLTRFSSTNLTPSTFDNRLDIAASFLATAKAARASLATKAKGATFSLAAAAVRLAAGVFVAVAFAIAATAFSRAADNFSAALATAASAFNTLGADAATTVFTAAFLTAEVLTALAAALAGRPAFLTGAPAFFTVLDFFTVLATAFAGRPRFLVTIAILFLLTRNRVHLFETLAENFKQKAHCANIILKKDYLHALFMFLTINIQYFAMPLMNKKHIINSTLKIKHPNINKKIPIKPCKRTTFLKHKKTGRWPALNPPIFFSLRPLIQPT